MDTLLVTSARRARCPRNREGAHQPPRSDVHRTGEVGTIHVIRRPPSRPGALAGTRRSNWSSRGRPAGSPGGTPATAPLNRGAGYVVTLTSARDANGSMLLDVSTDRTRAAAHRAAAAFLRTMSPLLAGPAGDRLAIGTYTFGDEPLVSVDLNVVLPPTARAEAEALARLTNQRGIWDLTTGTEVPIGGSGQSPITGPSRLLALIRERLPLLVGRAEVGLPAVDVRLWRSPFSP